MMSFDMQSETKSPAGRGEDRDMLSRKELEELLGYALTDEQWAENAKIMSEIADRMWEEDHPMDE